MLALQAETGFDEMEPSHKIIFLLLCGFNRDGITRFCEIVNYYKF